MKLYSASALIATAIPVHAVTPNLLRGGGDHAGRRDLEEESAPATRGLRVRVFQDVRRIMWDEDQGSDAELVPSWLQQWVVSLDGADLGRTDPATGVLAYESALLQGGASVCVRPGSSATASEAACSVAGATCVQPESSIDAASFPYDSEVSTNPNYSGVVWYDGPLSASGTDTVFSKVYVKDFCYTLQENDFILRDQMEEAWVRFSLIPASSFVSSADFYAAATSEAPTNFPSAVPSQQPSQQPSEVPSRMPSGTPSQMPSGAPSQTPSARPSISQQPSISAQPSQVPSWAPSMVPSRVPSRVPSTMPSGSPSAVPSSAPSRAPSGAPSHSQAPSAQPSAEASLAPTIGQHGSQSK